MTHFLGRLTLLGGMCCLISCASVLNPKYQTVDAKLSPETTIYVDGEKVSSRRTTPLKLQRDANTRQVRTEREGYKTEYDVVYPEKRSWLTVFSYVPGLYFFITPFLDNGPRAFNYGKDHRFSCTKELPTRAEDQKYIFLRNTSMNVEKDDISFIERKKKNFSKNTREVSRQLGEEDIDLDNTVFNNALNELLREQGFADEDERLLKRQTNTMYIDAEVNEVKFFMTNMVSIRYPQNVLNVQVSIEFELFDIYGVSQYKETVRGMSGNFSVDYAGDSPDVLIRESAEDAIVDAFIKFMDEEEVTEVSRLGKDGVEEIQPITILNNAVRFNEDLPSSIKSTVTVKTEKGHGSGLVITNDGYLVTNYHVIAGKDSLFVVVGEDELPAQVVRSSMVDDLALLKVDHQFDFCFEINKVEPFDIGQDVFAIGTPTSIELGQTLSKGIISGIRNRDEMELIQTDVAINPGNSGGPLVNKDGKLIGIVTSKISGVGVEGIAFSIPANKLLSSLAIQ